MCICVFTIKPGFYAPKSWSTTGSSSSHRLDDRTSGNDGSHSPLVFWGVPQLSRLPQAFHTVGCILYKYVYIYIYICMTILLVSWDDYYQYMESHKSHVPKHQPDICIHTVYTGPSPSSPSSSPRWFLGLPHIGRHCGEGIRCNLRTSAAHGAQQSGLASIGHAHLRNSRSGTIWIWDNLGSEEL